MLGFIGLFSITLSLLTMGVHTLAKNKHGFAITLFGLCIFFAMGTAALTAFTYGTGITMAELSFQNLATTENLAYNSFAVPIIMTLMSIVGIIKSAVEKNETTNG